MSLKKRTSAELFEMVNEDLNLLDDGSWVPDSDSIDATRTVLEEIETRMNTQVVNVALNSFDDEGNQTDTTNMDLTAKQVSDVVDHAAQLVIALRDIAGKQSGTEAFDQVCSELEDALTTAEIVELGSEALPALPLARSA